MLAVITKMQQIMTGLSGAAIIIKVMFSLLQGNGNNSSQTSENCSIPC
jgi:hypothetical protein